MMKHVSDMMTENDIKEVIKDRYDACAKRGGGAGAVCCPDEAHGSSSYAAEHGLYSQEDLALIPETALALSRACGNPTGFTDIRSGETVVDFGCGAGSDIVLAAHKVGPRGRVIGVDFAPQMIKRAKQAAAEANVSEVAEFVVSDLEHVGVADGIADVVISNCVINLCPEKEAVYREAFRILKPDGRLAISDIVYAEEIDPKARERFQSTRVGCVGGAIDENQYFQIIRDAGFSEIEVVTRHPLERMELGAMACCPGPEFSPVPAKDDIAAAEGKVVSIKFRTRKPARSR